MSSPRISVVVASHDRPLRLRWLLNALEDQTLAREQWEVVVGHDSSGPETEELLREHPLARAGTLRHIALAPGSAPPGANRNAAWRLARAALVAFTDDDCSPPPEWLAGALAAAERNPRAIVQGRTVEDPRESAIARAPHSRSQHVEPPSPWAQCCNIVYPRVALEQLGGFVEDVYTGEDTDLMLRARAAGVPLVGAPEAVTYHAVAESTLLHALRATRRWQDLPVLARRHPEIRREFTLGIFWKPAHALLPAAAVGVWLAGRRRNPVYVALAVPWLKHTMPVYGPGRRGRLRGALETPGQLAIQLAEVATLAAGSARHGALLI